MALLTYSRDFCSAALRRSNWKQNSNILELTEKKNAQHSLLMLQKRTLRLDRMSALLQVWYGSDGN